MVMFSKFDMLAAKKNERSRQVVLLRSHGCVISSSRDNNNKLEGAHRWRLYRIRRS
jgi:hypothetical protein